MASIFYSNKEVRMLLNVFISINRDFIDYSS